MQPININNQLDWSENVSFTVNKYFKQQYKDKPATLKMHVNGKDYVVNRPNHALAHGLRQGFLAVDIIKAIHQNNKTKQLRFNSPDGGRLARWVSRKMQDPQFLKKVEFAAAFQRTGRQSEVSSSKNLKLYNSYERQDAKNFDSQVKKHIGTLFKDQKEADCFKEAILWSTANEGKIDPKKSESLYFLRKVLHAAHDLDLRRMNKFDINRMKCSTVEELFGSQTIDNLNWVVLPQFNAEQQLVEKLWKRSGEYLAATGDRDVETQRGYQGHFCELAYQPKKMAKVLHQARQNSAISF